MHDATLSYEQYALSTLGTKWFLDFSTNMSAIPAGRSKMVPFLDLPGPSASTIQVTAQQAPGAVWYVLGEPNRRGISAADAVTPLHDIYVAIRAADPTARITSPSVLNWDFTCVGCGGYTPGRTWITAFLSQYRSQYNSDPPWDIWAIDAYPLDYENLPTVNAQIPIAQITGMWAFMDGQAAHRGKPIWVTEISLHWGWERLYLVPANPPAVPEPYALPCGNYRTDRVIDYLKESFDWLEANASSKNIQRWFMFLTYSNLAQPTADSAYAGASLFNSPGVGASLSSVGQFFRDRAQGIHKQTSEYNLAGASITCP